MLLSRHNESKTQCPDHLQHTSSMHPKLQVIHSRYALLKLNHEQPGDRELPSNFIEEDDLGVDWSHLKSRGGFWGILKLPCFNKYKQESN